MKFKIVKIYCSMLIPFTLFSMQTPTLNLKIGDVAQKFPLSSFGALDVSHSFDLDSTFNPNNDLEFDITNYYPPIDPTVVGKVATFLTNDNKETLKQELKSLSLHQLAELVKLVDFLGINEKTQLPLASVYKKKIKQADPVAKQKHEEIFSRFILPTNHHGYLKKAIKKARLQDSSLVQSGCLMLSGLGLKKLKGLSNLEFLVPIDTITQLDVSNNKLQELNPKKCLSPFKGLLKIIADNNRIQKLSSADFLCLPNGAFLSLRNNQIKTIGSKTMLQTLFTGPHGCTVDVAGNNLDHKQLQELNHLFELPLTKKCKNFLLHSGTLGLVSGISLSAIMTLLIDEKFGSSLSPASRVQLQGNVYSATLTGSFAATIYMLNTVRALPAVQRQKLDSFFKKLGLLPYPSNNIVNN